MSIELEDTRDIIAAESDTIKLSAELTAELNTRIENYKRDPTGTIPWETIKDEALERS